MQILSFQSAVSFGHVGHSAALLPLQRLGFEVWPIDTVQFSNHPGHGRCAGSVFPGARAAELVEGLDAIGALDGIDAVLSGYLGEAETGAAVLDAVTRIRRARPGALYLCDPVMGDEGGGLYVRPGIPEVFGRSLVPAADIVTPNRFELGILTGRSIFSPPDAVEASRQLLALGPKAVVVTSLDPHPGTIACLGVEAGGAWVVETPILDFAVAPNGAGDLLSALLLGRLLEGRPLPEALSLAVSSLFGVLSATRSLGRRELALVAAQEVFARPPQVFPARPFRDT